MITNRRAGGKNNRPAQSKQARKISGVSQPQTLRDGAGKSRRVRVNVPMPASLAAAIDEAVRIEGVDHDTLFHRAISAHIVRSQEGTQATGAASDPCDLIVEHVLDTLPSYHKRREAMLLALRCWTTVDHPARARIEEESSRSVPMATKVGEGRSKLVDIQVQCATLFYLWRSDVERQRVPKGDNEFPPDEDVVDGVARLGELIGRKLEEANEWFGEVESQLMESPKGGAR